MKCLKIIFFISCILITILSYLLTVFKIIPISIYGIFMGFYFFLQIFSSRYNHKIINKISNQNNNISLNDVFILIVGYREDEKYWEKCICSILNSKINNINIIISIDGDKDEDLIMTDIAYKLFYVKYYHIIQGNNVQVKILNCIHGGKRHAMYEGLTHIRDNYNNCKYIIVMDSDTIVEPNAFEELTKILENDESVGCCTGNLSVFNDHLLGKIINARYAYAFNIERSFMSTFGIMNCCSGPLSIYRANIILQQDILNDFINQSFLGNKCHPGDDRHLTNLILQKGFKSKQTHLAKASTEAPKEFIRFLRQQIRWMRSFYREQYWQILAIPNQHYMLAIVTCYELIYPFLITIWFIILNINNFRHNPFFINKIDTYNINFIRTIIFAYLVTILRTLMLMISFRKFIYIYNIFYLTIYLLFLMPLKMYAFLTCWNNNWNTSNRYKINFPIDFELTAIIFIITFWLYYQINAIYNSFFSKFILI